MDDSPLEVKDVNGNPVRVDLLVLAEAWTKRILEDQKAVDDQAEEVHPDVVFSHPSQGYVFTARVTLQTPQG